MQVCAEHKKPKKLMKHLGQIKVHHCRELLHEVMREQAHVKQVDIACIKMKHFSLKATLVWRHFDDNLGRRRLEKARATRRESWCLPTASRLCASCTPPSLLRASRPPCCTETELRPSARCAAFPQCPRLSHILSGGTFAVYRLSMI